MYQINRRNEQRCSKSLGHLSFFVLSEERKYKIMMNKISAVFGSHVFSDQVMRERLPKAVYKSLKNTIDKGEPLDTSIADSVAAAMKEWAMELGATHYTHWFQPLTETTAEKHDHS